MFSKTCKVQYSVDVCVSVLFLCMFGKAQMETAFVVSEVDFWNCVKVSWFCHGFSKHVKVQCSVDVCGFVFVLYIWSGLNGKCICLNELEFWNYVKVYGFTTFFKTCKSLMFCWCLCFCMFVVYIVRKSWWPRWFLYAQARRNGL